MLTVARVSIPEQVALELRERSAFLESFTQFTKEQLIGFKRPIAVVAAIVAPLLFAFVYKLTDLHTLKEVASSFGISTAMFVLGLWYVNRENLKLMYIGHVRARNRAKADLDVGFGQEVTLEQNLAPLFYEHEHGVICLADSGDGRTVYFDVDSLDEDPRWFLYMNGDMHRQRWSWVKLLGSGDVAEFKASGERMAKIGDAPFVSAPDASEAISLALGEPNDGEVLEKSLSEVRATIARLL